MTVARHPSRRRAVRRWSVRRRTRGQSLAEFAIVFPVFMIVLGGIIQFGVIFWGQNTLTQVARDLGRWEATQQFSPCDSATSRAAITSEADAIASSSTLIGYTPGTWTGNATTIAATTASEAVGADWARSSGSATCPPPDNSTVWFVTIKVNHHVPIFFPWIPGNGDLSTTAQFRMEPAPGP